MGTRAEAADLTRLQTAIAEVRSDAADIYRKSWVIVGHIDNSPLLIDVLSQVSSVNIVYTFLPVNTNYCSGKSKAYCVACGNAQTFSMVTSFRLPNLHDCRICGSY